MKIISITPVKRQKKIKITLEDESELELHETFFVHYSLYDGMELDFETIERIKSENERFLAREQAIRYLARRNHSTAELAHKLKMKGFREDIIRNLLVELADKKFIDDNVFTEQFVKDKVHIGKKGPLAIRYELQHKGVSNSTIDSCLDMLYPEELQLEIGIRLAEKKIKNSRKKTENEKRKEIYSYLAGRGFTVTTIQTILNKLLNQ